MRIEHEQTINNGTGWTEEFERAATGDLVCYKTAIGSSVACTSSDQIEEFEPHVCYCLKVFPSSLSFYSPRQLSNESGRESLLRPACKTRCLHSNSARTCLCRISSITKKNIDRRIGHDPRTIRQHLLSNRSDESCHCEDLRGLPSAMSLSPSNQHLAPLPRRWHNDHKRPLRQRRYPRCQRLCLYNGLQYRVGDRSGPKRHRDGCAVRGRYLRALLCTDSI